MNMHFVGYCTHEQACRIDTKKLELELSAIDRRANLIFARAKGRGAIFVECNSSPEECTAAVEAQAGRLGINLT